MNPELEKIARRSYYKQSAPSLTITIMLPAATLSLPRYSDLSDGIWLLNTAVYVSPIQSAFMYWPIDHGKRLVLQLLEKMTKNPSWVKQQLKRHNGFGKGLEERSFGVAELGKNFSEKTQQKCVDEFGKFLDQEFKRWACSLFIDLFDPFEKEILKYIFGNRLSEVSAADLQTLLLPDTTFLWEEQKSFEKIQQQFEKDGKQLSDAVSEMLSAHQKNFWWIENNYQTATVLGEDFFFARLSEKHQNAFWKELKDKKKKIIEKYGFDEQTRARIQQFADLAFFRDVRKKFTNIANWGVIGFFHGIAEKKGIPMFESDFVIPFLEYKAFVEGDPNLLETLKMRVKQGVWLIELDQPGDYLVETNQAAELFDRIERSFSGQETVYGAVASLGKATGPAKIILNINAFSKFREGDVLMTGMTRPEFVPLMKKASAIVTDEGGITSHAAIVSRELGIPCVIGTKNATRVLKDGWIVQVKANHGSITVIEKK